MKNPVIAATIVSTAVTLAVACGAQVPSSVQSTEAQAQKIGLLFASHGDINNPDKELENYIKVSFQKNVGIPLPMWTRKLIEDPAYRLSVKTVRSQYDVIGATNYYENSQLQAAAITKELQKLNPNAKAYVGFNFTAPYIEDTLEQMHKDGVERIVIVNKGAQFSYASSGENMEDALKWLKNEPSYNGEVYGVTHYGQDERFVQVMESSLREDIATAFPNKKASEVCILLGSHGLPQWLINTGDSAISQMKQTVVALRKRMPDYKIYHGFLNDDFFPGAKWVAPTTEALVPEMVKDGCKNVALDGRLSFTTHHRATLYDMNVVVKEALAKNGVYSLLLPNFDENREHAEFIANLTLEALNRSPLSLRLKPMSGKPLEPGSVGKPGTILFGVTHLDKTMENGWTAAANEE
ncbi:MAG: hypothetical protein RJB13_270 [Pseudomonadota bacterium]